MKDFEDRISAHLSFLYGQRQAESLWGQIKAIIADFKAGRPDMDHPEGTGTAFDQRDAILITYGDQVRTPGQTPLQSLGGFLNEYMRDVISGVHILPFYPYSSDDGFSVIDYRRVNPDLGTWEDIAAIGENFRLMFDAVINHISRRSEWFQAFLRGEKPYADYFITVDPATDLSQVVRPRALPLLTPVNTAIGIQHVWTTFSDDQMDLNYVNPEVLLEVIRILLEYVSRGAEIIRLDAIAYLWKEIGTPCIHLPQTHRVVKLIRAILDLAAPHVILITETNVPQQENISYFGNPIAQGGRTDEAQMVYQFPLAPLVLHSFHSGDATKLTAWASQAQPSPGGMFFNFIASHDGIGMMPARGLLSEVEIQALVEKTIAHGGRVSYKANRDGSQSVYEMNVTLFDALNDPSAPNPSLDARRFLASQAIMLALAGVPGIYFHSLFGLRNCQPHAGQSGMARSINREKMSRASLDALLADATAHHACVFEGYCQMLRVRRGQAAFHPGGGQRTLSLNPAIFALLRTPPDGNAHLSVFCLVNVSAEPQTITLHLGERGLSIKTRMRDLLDGQLYSMEGGHILLKIEPYQVLWLQQANDR